MSARLKWLNRLLENILCILILAIFWPLPECIWEFSGAEAYILGVINERRKELDDDR